MILSATTNFSQKHCCLNNKKGVRIKIIINSRKSLQAFPGYGTPQFHLSVAVGSCQQKSPKLSSWILTEVVVAEYQTTDGGAPVWLKVVKTLWFLVTAIVHQTPVDLPELEMAVLTGCGKDSTVRREGHIMDDLGGGRV